MEMFFLDGQGSPELYYALRGWVASHRGWSQRLVPTNSESADWLNWVQVDPPVRMATIQEVAVDLVEDPNVLAAIQAANSPLAHLIERTVLQLGGLSEAESKLLVGALGEASKMIEDQNRPLVQRADVLIGVGVVVGVLILIGALVYLNKRTNLPTSS